MKFSFTIIVLFLCNALYGQKIDALLIDNTHGLKIVGASDENGTKYLLSGTRPLLSFDINDVNYTTSEMVEDGIYFYLKNKVRLEFMKTEHPYAWSARITIKNITDDTLKLSNIVPFGESGGQVYISGRGDEWLSKTKLFLPGRAPLSVIVPDNAWELGYASYDLENIQICALARRTKWQNAERKRFETILYPNGEVEYTLYAELFKGEWQDGLKRVFQERYLYDLEYFDASLYERPDLRWIRRAYIIHLMMAWDHHFYEAGEYKVVDFIRRGKKWYGGDDVIGIWPTWPTLGLDQRNQWDLYRDLPGGLPALKHLSEQLKNEGTKLFIAYNPWDKSTRKEDHLKGMAELIQKTDADGVVLDTRGSSSKELQEAADEVKKGVIMYSEGMAIPKDMPGIIAGRVHNALYYPPILNLNKFIRPDFAIFRVAELTHERIRREFALAFFNGYGTEINMFRPGQPEWIESDYRFLGRTTRILRENHTNFISKDWTPVITTTVDSIYVNKWPGKNKIVYTIFSLVPEGFYGPLMEVEPAPDTHFIDIWNHEEVLQVTLEGRVFAQISIPAFARKYLGSNNEGAVGCIARLPDLIDTEIVGSKVKVRASNGQLIFWYGEPDYEKTPVIITDESVDIGRYEGKIVVQLFENDLLLDEEVLFVKPGTPKPVSSVTPGHFYKNPQRGMVKIPAGDFKPVFKDGGSFIYYPEYDGPEIIKIKSYLMDIYPVTNVQYEKFLKKSGYKPKDSSGFLKHWINGKSLEGQENYPVVYVSREDARAYAHWAGKRLPTEIEWQYAAQTTAHFNWPWGMKYDSLMCNPGNGRPEPVGAYSHAANPYGLQDLTGSVWQLTNDKYESGSYTYSILKGGSYFKPTSSWWYVKGGPQPLQHRQILLHVSAGFERNATVGFRCVADLKHGE